MPQVRFSPPKKHALGMSFFILLMGCYGGFEVARRCLEVRALPPSAGKNVLNNYGTFDLSPNLDYTALAPGVYLH